MLQKTIFEKYFNIAKCHYHTYSTPIPKIDYRERTCDTRTLDIFSQKESIFLVKKLFCEHHFWLKILSAIRPSSDFPHTYLIKGKKRPLILQLTLIYSTWFLFFSKQILKLNLKNNHQGQRSILNSKLLILNSFMGCFKILSWKYLIFLYSVLN